MTEKLKGCGAGCFVLLCVFLGLLFVPLAWRNLWHGGIRNMAHQVTVGMSHQQVEDAIGSPDNSENDETWFYSSMTRGEPQLMIEFDTKKTVMSVEFNPMVHYNQN